MEVPANRHETRESWLCAATNELRPYFSKHGYTIPPNIRYGIAFTSTGRKGKRVGECWHSSLSDDETWEIFIRADRATGEQVLGVLVKELVHTVLPPHAGHGKLFRAA